MPMHDADELIFVERSRDESAADDAAAMPLRRRQRDDIDAADYAIRRRDSHAMRCR